MPLSALGLSNPQLYTRASTSSDAPYLPVPLPQPGSSTQSASGYVLAPSNASVAAQRPQGQQQQGLVPVCSEAFTAASGAPLQLCGSLGFGRGRMATWMPQVYSETRPFVLYGLSCNGEGPAASCTAVPSYNRFCTVAAVTCEPACGCLGNGARAAAGRDYCCGGRQAGVLPNQVATTVSAAGQERPRQTIASPHARARARFALVLSVWMCGSHCATLHQPHTHALLFSLCTRARAPKTLRPFTPPASPELLHPLLNPCCTPPAASPPSPAPPRLPPPPPPPQPPAEPPPLPPGTEPGRCECATGPSMCPRQECTQRWRNEPRYCTCKCCVRRAHSGGAPVQHNTCSAHGCSRRGPMHCIRGAEEHAGCDAGTGVAGALLANLQHAVNGCQGMPLHAVSLGRPRRGSPT